MSATFTPSLGKQQIAGFHEEGYLIVRNVLSSREAADLRRVVREQVQRGAYPPTLSYPEPAKYTVSGNRMAEPGLASIAEHPTVVGAVESALGGLAHLTASVAYLRTPSDKGGGAHSDYKRWRPVGSSMNWVFAIIPLNDFDTSFGPFMVSPKSHKLPRVIDPQAHILDLTAPDRERLLPFIDPELKAGDLLMVNEHVWHQAPAGTTSEDRCGIFNKYCAADAPPAAGYYPYNRAALDALSDAGKRLLPVCFDQPITTTRLLIENASGFDSRYLLCRDADADVWKLPGGEGWEEESSGLGRGLANWLAAGTDRRPARVGSVLDVLHRRLGAGRRGLPGIRFRRRPREGRCTGKRQPRLVHARRVASPVRRHSPDLLRGRYLGAERHRPRQGQGVQSEPASIRMT